MKKLSLHSLKIRNTRFKNLLLECYCLLQDIYGTDGNDILCGRAEFLNQDEVGKQLKIKIRKIFENK